MIDREARRRLHHKLIDIKDKPCLWCGSKDDREIDRVVEGYRGGKYIMSNVRVLCKRCHIKRHNKQKFAMGDRVVINGRCPHWLVSQLRHNRLRTITAVYYARDKQCCYYGLGNNKIGDASADLEAYSFRSYMLHHPIKQGVGRPRLATKCTVPRLNQKLGGQVSELIPEYLKPVSGRSVGLSEKVRQAEHLNN